MPYANEEIIDALKRAREAKGLSQRALSARTGVPQSHISKIEAGNADIRLSSLVELARALELDIKLVPRRAVPAVDSIVHSIAPRPVSPIDKNLARELKQSLETLEALRIYPDALEAARTLQENLRPFNEVQRLKVDPGRLHEITRPLRQMQKLLDQQKALDEAFELPARTLEQLDALADASRQLRSFSVHSGAADPGTPRPAYRLDNDDDHDDDRARHHPDQDRRGDPDG